MTSIETKYFGYCNVGGILRASPKTGANNPKATDLNFMNKNTIQVISAALATGALIGFGSTKLTGDYVIGASAVIGYLTVAALVALGNIDSRRSERNYTA
jgi:hypothetical protein